MILVETGSHEIYGDSYSEYLKSFYEIKQALINYSSEQVGENQSIRLLMVV